MQKRWNSLVKGLIGAIAVALLAAISLPSSVQAATGTVRVAITSGGFIFGLKGGQGTLVFRGRSYPLTVGGISAGALVGASTTELIGRAYHLHRAADIAGTYTAIGGTAAVAGGAGAIELQNSRGVILRLSGRTIGLQFSVSLSGMEIRLR